VKKTSILVVEDHEIYLTALLDLLGREPEFQVAGVARTAEEGFKRLQECSVDLALVDIGLPRMDGISFVKRIHAECPTLLVVMLSGYLSPVYVKKSLQAGARGYLLKDCYADIVVGIKRVIDGEIYLSKELDQTDPGFVQI
jgi:DNA-binding NarL/FixJ family response regulator